ncbi:hypothetical protein [Pedobacter heparinus]|uniref:hypothetical protein n=1 Tax=Pedobacter heparinus TaxID=984 RepID=UPI002930E5A5|nr:hypothetical protein [Pedobacter heparinus]
MNIKIWNKGQLGSGLMLALLVWPALMKGQTRYSISKKNHTIEITSGSASYVFNGNFSILYSEKDPDMALRPAGIDGVSYNVPTWKTYPGKKAYLKQTKTDASVAGDGFDDKILRSAQGGRTTNIANGAMEINISPASISQNGNTVVFKYKSNPLFNFSARLVLLEGKYPSLEFTLEPLANGYFSAGYTGAPTFKPESLKEIWQPFIWQEMRFPDKPYLTTAHMSPVPATLLNDGKNTLGVMAAPKYLPFDPLPLLTNSQFGIALRNQEGNAQNAVYAPILGGIHSKMKAGTAFEFQVYLIVEPMTISRTYEQLARTYFGFKDYRKNDIASLNQALDNITAYSLSKYALFVDSLKGCAYSTDVPGAVKNVSSLNPLELSIVMDNKTMFDKRAYPLIEYMLSREKFLFSLDSTQKIQSPSRKLKGPVAPISELVSLYNVFNKENPLFREMAKNEYFHVRERNLDVKESGNSWMNSMHLYKATGDKAYLEKTTKGADEYLKTRVERPQTTFRDKTAGGLFFWPTFTNKWIDLMELYELTGHKKYLDAAQEGARHYAMFTWMAPAIPDSMITVNKDGKAPMYWYLKSKGHKQMYYPEEKAPAWRLSEVGLTPESSGTSTGHRAIFMANYAPWMLKLGYYTNDPYLKEIAKAAVIGRYRNFPGYHINTERTTAYEKMDFPLHDHKDQSVNSFHYNHILPMASMLLDYLVTDAFVRSEGKIDFPAEFIEGYAYLQSNFYGSKKGVFYDEKDIQLWMPGKLLKSSNVELNYISGRKGNTVFIAFMNQSVQPVTSSIELNQDLVKLSNGSAVSVYQGDKWMKGQAIGAEGFPVTVAANGLTVIKIEQAAPIIQIQDKLLAAGSTVKNDQVDIDLGNARAFSFRFGNLSKAYVYLQDDDSVFSEVSMSYSLKGSKKNTITDKDYPFEFTVDLPQGDNSVTIKLDAVRKDGSKVSSTAVKLGN